MRAEPLDAFISRRLSELRALGGKSIRKFALQLRVAPAHLSRMEKGARLPTIDTLSRVCDAVGITLSEFFDEKKPATALHSRQHDRVQELLAPLDAAGRDEVVLALQAVLRAATRSLERRDSQRRAK